MYKNNIRDVKAIFLLTVIIALSLFTSTTLYLKDSPYFTQKYMLSALTYYKHKLDFNRDSAQATSAVIGTANDKDKNKNIKIEQYTSSIPVLLYHGIIEKPDGKNVQLKNFREQLFELKKAGWQTITLEDFYKFMKEEKQLPESSFLLTFDDGRKDSYYPVDPILKALNYTAVMFVITAHSLTEKNNSSTFYLGKAELRQMLRTKRWEIQAHTRHGHDIYTNQSLGKGEHFYSTKFFLKEKNRYETDEEFRERLLEDFIGAKQDIENKLEQKAYAFAFPFNDFGQNNKYFPQVEEIVLDAAASVYELLFYQTWPSEGFRANYPDKRKPLLKRILVQPGWNSKELLHTLESTKDKLIPLTDDFSSDKGWLNQVGVLNIKDKKLYIGSSINSTVGIALLDGTYLFEDYIFKAKVDYLNATTISALGALRDSDNFFACDFSKDSIFIRQTKKDKTTYLYENTKDFFLPRNNFHIGIKVGFDEVECLLDNQTVAGAYNLNPFDLYGGIAIKTWDPKPNSSIAIIDKIRIDALPVAQLEVKKPLAFEQIDMKVSNKDILVSFSLLDNKKEFLKRDGTLIITIKDQEGVLLEITEIKVKNTQYSTFFSKELGKKAYRFTANITSQQLSAAKDNLIFAKYTFITKDGKKIDSGILRRLIPSQILDRTQRYLKSAISIGKTAKQADFTFTINKVGKYIPLVDLQDSVSLIHDRSPNLGAPDGVAHYRIDFSIKNSGDKKRLIYKKSYLKDNLGNIYEIRYENDTSALDGIYKKGETKHSFLLFYLPRQETDNLTFYYESQNEYHHYLFLFEDLPKVS